MYNFLLDKLEDEYDKRKESDKEADEEEEEEDDDDNNKSKNDEILCALKQSIEKIKKYYTFTSGLIYTAATGKFYSLYIIYYTYIYIFNCCFFNNSTRSSYKA